MSFLFGRKRFLTKIAGSFGVYFRRNNDPADTDESCFTAECEERLGMHISQLPGPKFPGAKGCINEQITRLLVKRKPSDERAFCAALTLLHLAV